KPNVAVAPGARAPFHPTFLAVTAAAFCVTVAFQDWLIRCPLAKVKVAVHNDDPDVPALRTDTSPWKPSFHWPTILYVAAQVPDGGGVSPGGGGAPSADTSAGYQRSDIFWKPASFGCTPSPVSVEALKPVHWSTTVIGDADVVFPAAQPGIALL